ncbi:hypothetical protein AB1Y20_014477 [Prymnesium parvum]|uniref:Uncharacterized protein n=1 Tax=Prymnesium parvum TaxID=97485 RepID=A0AB34IEG1_PRYPA
MNSGSTRLCLTVLLFLYAFSRPDGRLSSPLPHYVTFCELEVMLQHEGEETLEARRKASCLAEPCGCEASESPSQHRSGYPHAAAPRWPGSSATKASHQLVAPRRAGGERAGGLKSTTVARAHLRCFDAALMLCMRMPSSLKRDGSQYLPPRAVGSVHSYNCAQLRHRPQHVGDGRQGGGGTPSLAVCGESMQSWRSETAGETAMQAAPQA